MFYKRASVKGINLTCDYVNGTLKSHDLIQVKGTEQYFPVVLFIVLHKVVITFESSDEILKCDHSNESY